MKRLVGFLVGGVLDRMADAAAAEFRRLSHCHRCGACLCLEHTAISDDTWDQQRVVCRRCLRFAS